jgi:hypothetical protein
MASAQEVQDEVNGVASDDHHASLLHEGGPKSLQHVARSLQDKVSHAAREVTLWLPRRSLAALRKKRGDNDTTLGHAIDGASASLLALEVALRVAKKVDADLTGIDGLE